jgi:hypothetical protein
MKPLYRDVVTSFLPNYRQLQKMGVPPEAAFIAFSIGRIGRPPLGYAPREFKMDEGGKSSLSSFLLNKEYTKICCLKDGRWRKIMVRLAGGGYGSLLPATINIIRGKIHLQLLDNTTLFTVVPPPSANVSTPRVDAVAEKVMTAVLAREAPRLQARAVARTIHTCGTKVSDTDVYIEEVDEQFYLFVGREFVQINYCPICGARAPEQIGSQTKPTLEEGL